MLFEVKLEKIVHGGQAIGDLPDGKKVFVWNALPGERVLVRTTKRKRSYAEGIAQQILEPSLDRIEPIEENFLATSPWQIMDFEAENRFKLEIVQELFRQAHVSLPELRITSIPGRAAPGKAVRDDAELGRAAGGSNLFASPRDDRGPQKNVFLGQGEKPGTGVSYGYRNKMEYSFWGDDAGVHLALHKRGSHGKEIITGSALAMPAVDAAARAVLLAVNAAGIRAGDLKTVIVRSNQKGETAAALFVKPESFPPLNQSLLKGVKGLHVYHSDPKSPASVATRRLTEYGDVMLSDELLGKTFSYDVRSFFQVNLPMFERALEVMKTHGRNAELTDMYAGVGSIGLSIATKAVNLVELDPASTRMARLNAKASGLDAEVVEASTEKALEYITGQVPVVFDPPRAGLHSRTLSRLLEVKPPGIIYLSCNPATQARDMAQLASAYSIEHFEIYNFFPRTPHIETLAVLKRH